MLTKTAKILILALALIFAPSTFAATPEKKESHHNISLEYGVLTVMDYAAIFAIAFTSIAPDDDDSSDLMLGAISLNYGYEFTKFLETGLILNFAMPLEDAFYLTFMPRIKFNMNSNGFVNPYIEFDAGATTDFDDIIPMFHITLIGLEIGPVYFQILGFGQRGTLYAGGRYEF